MLQLLMLTVGIYALSAKSIKVSSKKEIRRPRTFVLAVVCILEVIALQIVGSLVPLNVDTFTVTTLVRYSTLIPWFAAVYFLTRKI